VGDWEGAPLLAIRLVYTALVFALLVGNYAYKTILRGIRAVDFQSFLVFQRIGSLCLRENSRGTSAHRLGVCRRVMSVFVLFSPGVVGDFHVDFIGLLGAHGTRPCAWRGACECRGGHEFSCVVGQLPVTRTFMDHFQNLGSGRRIKLFACLGDGDFGRFGRSNALDWWSQRTQKSSVPRRDFLLLAGVWNTVFPINKSLWTSSYVLLSGGFAMLF